MTTEIRAPRGSQISCKGWQQEAALRMLMNSLDEEVAGRPLDLLNGDAGAVRNWECYHAIVRALRVMNDDETLLVNHGKSAGTFRTHPLAPRVLIASANFSSSVILGNREIHEVSYETGRENGQDPERIGLIAHGQMAAGSWMNTGTQEILLGSYTTFAAAALKHFHGDLSGKLVVSGGCGRMGGAQPLAATLNGGAFLGIEVDVERIKKCIRAGACDYCVNDLDEALRILKIAVRQKQAISVGLVGNCADVIPELARRGVVPDLLTDQTSAHDPLNGYVPSGVSPEEAMRLRSSAPEEYLRRSYESIGRHAAGMIGLQKLGSVVFEYGNNIRAAAFEHGGVKDAYAFPGFVPAYLCPFVCEGRGPARWVALSGDPADIYRADGLALQMFPEDAILSRWIQLARKHVKFQGLPARACWLSAGEQARLGDRMNGMVAKGELKAPIVLGRDHLDCGPVAPRSGEAESTKDGTCETVDHLVLSPFLSALLGAASGASWVSIHSADDFSGSACAAVADGTPEAAARIERVFIHS
ncbi:MAG: urocanate hydratase [Terriglobia bacterium]